MSQLLLHYYTVFVITNYSVLVSKHNVEYHSSHLEEKWYIQKSFFTKCYPIFKSISFLNLEYQKLNLTLDFNLLTFLFSFHRVPDFFRACIGLSLNIIIFKYQYATSLVIRVQTENINNPESNIIVISLI